MAKKDTNARKLQELEAQSLNSARQMLGVQTEILDILEQQNIQRKITIEEQQQGKSLSQDEQKAIADTVLQHKKYVQSVQKQIKEQKESLSLWKAANKELNKFHATHLSYFQYLMEADKTIKSLVLNLGISAGKGEDIRTSIEGAAIHAASLNMSTTDLIQMYGSYVDQVGRTVSLTSQQMEAMAEIAKGTGLAKEGAAEFAGTMEILGKDAISVNKTVQGILETSERMGVNATKVLKTVGANFKTLQTYTFRKGVQGMGNMASYGEKFRIDIDTALSAAEKSRRLEDAVELASKLQVLGGEFAKSDPFEMLFLSRNDPEKFQKKIAELTKGMATLNKTADGFEYQLASPMARDMLEQAGKALGISLDKMTEMALQQKKFNDMRQQMFSAGYTKDQKEVIEGMSQMDSSTGKFFVTVKGVRRDIADLTGTELQYLKTQQKSLKQRAKDAQAFDDQFKIFIEELKATGLPLLKGINSVLNDYIRPAMDWIRDFLKDMNKETRGWMKYLGMGLAALMGAKPLVGMLTGAFKYLMYIPKGIWGMIGKGGGGVATATQTMTGGAIGGGGGAGGGGALKALGQGAGVGLAATGVGAGIMLAAKGIESLAGALEKLPEKKIEQLKSLTTTIGTFITIGAGIGVLAGLFGAAVAPMMGFGAAVLLIGGGIGIAAWGIGQMAEGMGLLMKNAKPSDILAMAGGMTALATSSMLFANPLTIAGLASMAGSVALMANYGDGMEKVGNAFANVSAVLKGSRDDYAAVRETIDSIAAADFSNLKALTNINKLFSQPLQVQFADKEVAMVANITLEIDGEKFVENLNVPTKVAVSNQKYKQGKSSPKSARLQ